MNEETPKIYEAMAAILADVDAIAKERHNDQQRFLYRGIEDGYNMLHPIMSEHKVFTVPRVLSTERTERPSKQGGVIGFTVVQVEYDFVSGEDGSKVTVGPVPGEAMDSGDKSAIKAMSVAHKTVLFQTFLVPTENIDPDAETHELGQDIRWATDEQWAQIQDYRDAGKITDATEKWLRDHDNKITETQAARLLKKLGESE